MRGVGWLLGVWLSWMSGCAPMGREELKQEVLKTDPEFTQALERHRELANRMETYERELALKRGTVERAIAQMRGDLQTATQSVRAKTAELRSRMEPERKRLALALAMAAEELQAKRAQRASLGRSIAKLRKAIRASGEGWTPQERARREEQAKDMLVDASRLDQELAAMKEHIRLLRIKLLLIKL